MKQVVLGSGFLIALERGTSQAVAIAEELYSAGAVAHVPTGVYAQVWRGSARQHAIARLVRAKMVRLHDLTAGVACRVGVLLGKSGTSDVVDGHIVLLATELNALVLTSDPGDLARIDPSLTLVSV